MTEGQGTVPEPTSHNRRLYGGPSVGCEGGSGLRGRTRIRELPSRPITTPQSEVFQLRHKHLASDPGKAPEQGKISEASFLNRQILASRGGRTHARL